VWDLDMNYGATRHFGIPPDGFLGSFEILMGEEHAENVIISEGEPDVTLPRNVHVIPSRRKLEHIDEGLANKNKFIVRQHVLLEPLKRLEGRYDYIFLDTAPNATTPTIAAYAAAEWFLLSAMPDPFAVAGLQDALQDIDSARGLGNEKLAVLGVVLSSVAHGTRLGNVLIDYVEKTFTLPDGHCLKFKTEISRSTVVPQAQKLGSTLFQTEPKHKVTEQYRELAREIEARLEIVKRESERPLMTANA
jgi:chromosome partitioning protein